MPSPRTHRIALRLASTWTIHQSTAVVDTAYHMTGATAVFSANPFERRFRDMHAIAQQLQGRDSHYEDAGKSILSRQSRGRAGEGNARTSRLAALTTGSHAHRTPRRSPYSAETRARRCALRGLAGPCSGRRIMPRGDKSSYTSKQKRKAQHIEEGYEQAGVGKEEAERRAWATVNKETGGGNRERFGTRRSRHQRIRQARRQDRRQGFRKPIRGGAVALRQKSGGHTQAQRRGEIRRAQSRAKEVTFQVRVLPRRACARLSHATVAAEGGMKSSTRRTAGISRPANRARDFPIPRSTRCSTPIQSRFRPNCWRCAG